MAEPSVTVLYLAGAGRSGSTLLECMLGQIPGVVAAGEVTHVWDRGFHENQLCGCGTPFRECAYWREVVTLAFGGLESSAYADASRLRASLCRLRNIPRFAAPALMTPGFRGDYRRYADILSRLYRAVARVAGARVVVDSSKYPPEAYLLRGVAGVELAVVHLVRHSNAVAYAWQKWKVRPDVHWTTAYMARYPFLQTALGWIGYNLILGALRGSVPYRRIRYEDLVTHPRETIEDILPLIPVERPGLGFISTDSVTLAANHTASGNPMRFETGRVPLRLDSEWRDAAPLAQRALVTALTFPLLWRYGYR